jgi:hypothetical protein
VYAFRWTNPFAGKAIASLELLSAEGAPVVVVFAISVER